MKVAALHMKNFGHEKATVEFYNLIDELKYLSESKYPNRTWSDDTYYSIAFEWLDKQEELEERIKELKIEK